MEIVKAYFYLVLFSLFCCFFVIICFLQREVGIIGLNITSVGVSKLVWFCVDYRYLPSSSLRLFLFFAHFFSALPSQTKMGEGKSETLAKGGSCLASDAGWDLRPYYCEFYELLSLFLFFLFYLILRKKDTVLIYSLRKGKGTRERRLHQSLLIASD